MKVIPTAIDGVVIIESPIFRDERGYFNEVHHSAKLAEQGFHATFVQDNQSGSAKNVLRGLHFQTTRPQGKLVRAVSGAIFDVAVDLRRSSPTFGQWYGTTLEAGDGRQLYIPPGFAHGFYVVSDWADVSYKCTELYDAASDSVTAWNDPDIGVRWPVPNGISPLLSPRDAAAPAFANIRTFD